MPRESTLEIYRDRLFDDLDRMDDLTPTVRTQILRYRAIFSLKLQKPHISNADVADMLKAEFGVTSISQAYRDISAVERLLGSVRTSEKAFIRYMVTETLKEAIGAARAAGDLKNMVAAAAALGKYSRLDQEDQEPLPYEEIVPRPVEYTNDPQVLGIPIPKEGVKAFVDRIKKKHIEAVDVEYEEVKND